MKRTLLVVSLVLFAWLGSGAISYSVVELTGGGPPGPQGEQGERGERGHTGSGATEPLFLDPCSEAADAYQDGLARPGLSYTQLQGLYDHAANVCNWD